MNDQKKPRNQNMKKWPNADEEWKRKRIEYAPCLYFCQ